jgi:hypothetical protein
MKVLNIVLVIVSMLIFLSCDGNAKKEDVGNTGNTGNTGDTGDT